MAYTLINLKAKEWRSPVWYPFALCCWYYVLCGDCDNVFSCNWEIERETEKESWTRRFVSVSMQRKLQHLDWQHYRRPAADGLFSLEYCGISDAIFVESRINPLRLAHTHDPIHFTTINCGFIKIKFEKIDWHTNRKIRKKKIEMKIWTYERTETFLKSTSTRSFASFTGKGGSDSNGSSVCCVKLGPIKLAKNTKWTFFFAGWNENTLLQQQRQQQSGDGNISAGHIKLNYSLQRLRGFRESTA